ARCRALPARAVGRCPRALSGAARARCRALPARAVGRCPRHVGDMGWSRRRRCRDVGDTESIT
ncbi:hypothetical protein ACFY2R_04700, partial [Micromonospora olivasterospora]|uniref:hypothetical protein n=1 Tax=Micromonospora olivasterospora TaxID=1880 RepID=UPI00368043D7